METLINSCTLFPILSGIGGALLGGFIVWAWQQLRLQSFTDEFQSQANLLELTKGEKEHLNKRLRELQEKMAVFRTREYQLTGEVTEWRDNFILIERQYKSVKEQLGNKEREIEDIKSSMHSMEAEEEELSETHLEYEDDVAGQTPTVVEALAENVLHEEEEAEEETHGIEATANSDGTTSTKEGMITLELEKDELQELEYYLLEKQQLVQKIEDLTKEKSEETERWVQKYQGLQIQLQELQQQLNLSSTINPDVAILENKYQKALEDLGVVQTQCRFLEQERLKIWQEKESTSSDWQAKYEELQQHYQTIKSEAIQLQNQLNETAKTADEQQMTLAALAPQENWEERYKNVVAQFINAKEKIKGLEVNQVGAIAQHIALEKEHLAQIAALKNEVSEKVTLIEGLEIQIGTFAEQLLKKEQLVEDLTAKLDVQIVENQNNAENINRVETALRLLERQFEASHQHIDQLEAMRTQLQSENINLTATHQSLLKQFEASQQHIDELEKALSELNAAATNWEEAKAQLEQKWSNQYEATMIQYNDAIDQLQGLKQTQQNLVTSNQQKEQARIRLSEELNSAQQAFNAQVNANAKLEAEVEELLSLYEEANTQLIELLQKKKIDVVQKESELNQQDYKEMYETLLAQQEAYQKSISELEEELYRNKNA